MSETASSLFEEFAAIKSYIAAARAIVKDGFMPDMSALEQRITGVCLRLQKAELQEQSQCLPELASLLKSLDECERDLRAWKETKKESD